MRVFDYDYQVDGKPVLLPDAAVELVVQDLAAPDAGLDEGGFYHAAALRRNVRQWDFSYKVLTAQEYRYLWELLDHCFSFSFRGTDGQPEQALCRCDGFRSELYDREKGIYRNLRFSVKEC